MVHTGWLSLWEGNAISFFSHETKASVCSLPTTQRRASWANDCSAYCPVRTQLSVLWSFLGFFFNQENNLTLMVTKCIWIERRLLSFKELPVLAFCVFIYEKRCDQVPDRKSVPFKSTTNFLWRCIYLFFESPSLMITINPILNSHEERKTSLVKRTSMNLVYLHVFK